MRGKLNLTLILASLIVILVIIASILSYSIINLNSKYVSLEERLGLGITKFNSTVSNVIRKIDSLLTLISKLNSSVRYSASNTSKYITKLLSEVEDLRSKLKELNVSLGKYVSRRELSELVRKVSNLESMLKSAASSSDVEAIRESLSNVQEEIKRLTALLQFPAEITDATGKVVVIPSMPHRIVSLLPSVTEILFAVNAGDQVVGVDEFSNYPPEVVEAVKKGKIVNIGSGWYPNIEKIMSLNPDLVIGVDSVVSHHTLKEIFSREGIPLILLPDKTVNDVITSIVIVGKATGHLERATKLAQQLRSTISDLRLKVTDYVRRYGRPRVAVIVWLKPIWVAGNGTWLNDLIELAGGVNAFSNTSGWASVSPEALIKASPDIIIVTQVGVNASTAENILKTVLGSSYKSIPAIAKGRVYCIEGTYNDALIRPGPRVVDALKILISIIHPEVFGLKNVPNDLNPNTFKLPP